MGRPDKVPTPTHTQRVVIEDAAKVQIYFQITNKTMEKVIIFFKNWLFNVRKKQAIKRAQQLANEQRKKFLVLNFNGKPTVISMKDIHKLIRTKQVKRRYDADYFREMAFFTAMPK